MSKKMRRRKTLPRKPAAYKVRYTFDEDDFPLDLIESTIAHIRQWVHLLDDPVSRAASNKQLRMVARYCIIGQLAEQQNSMVARLDRPGAKNPVREAVIQAMRRYLKNHAGTLDDFLDSVGENPNLYGVSIEPPEVDGEGFEAVIEHHDDYALVGKSTFYTINALRNLWTEARNSPLTRYQ